MAEKEQTNNHEAGLLDTSGNGAGNRRGQIIGGIVALAALGTAAFLGYHEHSITVDRAERRRSWTEFVTGAPKRSAPIPSLR